MPLHEAGGRSEGSGGAPLSRAWRELERSLKNHIWATPQAEELGEQNHWEKGAAPSRYSLSGGVSLLPDDIAWVSTSVGSLGCELTCRSLGC